MASKVLESPPLPGEELEGLPARDRPGTVGAAGPAVFAPVVAAAAALAVHRLLPDRQLVPMSWMDALPFWRHPYPVVLVALFAAWLLLTAAQGAWPRLRPGARYYGPLLAGMLGVWIVWDLVTLKLNWLTLPYFPGPDLVFGGLVEDRVFLLESTEHSLLLLLAGYGTGVLAGLLSGVLIGWFPHCRYWGMPVLKLIGPIPATALVAVAMTLSTKAFVCGTALIGFAVWFPVTMLTYSGIANVRLSYLDVARTLGAGRLYLIFRVAIPAAMPHIFIGLFMGLLVSFLTLIVAEGVGVQSGLGWYLKWRQSNMEYDKMYASLLIMAVFFSAILTLLFKVRDRVLGWQKGVIRW